MEWLSLSLSLGGSHLDTGSSGLFQSGTVIAGPGRPGTDTGNGFVALLAGGITGMETIGNNGWREARKSDPLLEREQR